MTEVRDYLGFDNYDQVLDTYHDLKKLHGELASLYRLKSRDTKRIELLWRQIEKREHLLELNGLEYA